MQNSNKDNENIESIRSRSPSPSVQEARENESSGTVVAKNQDDNHPGPSNTNILKSAPFGKNLNQHRITQFTNRPMAVTRSKEIDAQLIKLICSEYLPFSLVENEQFKKFVSLLNPSYVVPSRKTMSNSILDQVYIRLKDCVKNELKTATAISVTTDGWTSVSNDSYIALTVHFINEKNELRSFLLECVKFNERHTAEHLANETKKTLQDWTLFDKVVALVTDNAANMTAAARLGGWPHLPCFAHSLNLIVQTGLKEIAITHKKVKEVVEYFKRSPQASEKLRVVEKQMGFPELNVKQDMPIRWNSTYEMFQRILEIKDPLISTMAIVNFEKSCLSPEDFQIIEYSCRILKCFYEVTIDISAEKNVTISKIIYLSRALMRHCKNVQEENGLPSDVLNMATKMIEKINNRFINIEENSIIAEATFLDPRFKKQGFINIHNFEKTKNAITRIASSILTKVGTDIQEKTENVQEIDNDFSIWRDYDKTTANLIQISDNASSASIIEVNRYLQEQLLKRTGNPLEWWKEREHIYPRLYYLAKKKLCVPATSVACERAFSKAGMVISKRRSSLSAAKVNKLLFINANLNYI